MIISGYYIFFLLNYNASFSDPSADQESEFCEFLSSLLSRFWCSYKLLNWSCYSQISSVISLIEQKQFHFFLMVVSSKILSLHSLVHVIFSAHVWLVEHYFGVNITLIKMEITIEMRLNKLEIDKHIGDRTTRKEK